MEFLYKEFGEKLKKIRKDQKYTQKDVNNRIGVGTDTLWRLENGLVEPTLYNLSKLSKFYKIDLIELLLDYRKPSSLLSKDLIKRTNKYISESNLSKLKDEIEAIKKDLEADNGDFEYIENATGLMTTYLDALTNISAFDMKNKESLSQDLEISLQAISKSNNMLTDKFLYAFEITMALFLSIVHRRNDDLEKSLDILNALEANLKSNDYLQEMKNYYLGTTLYNKCITYHRFNQHEKIIETVDTALEEIEIFAQKKLLFLLLFRKAIAMYFLGDQNYPYILYTVLSHSVNPDLEHFKHALFEIYDMKHPVLDQFR